MPDPTKPASHDRVRRTFIAGLFAFVPLAVTAFIIVWIDSQTRGITKWLFNVQIPFLGVIITLAGVYLTGMITTSFLGKFILRLVDGLLGRLPVVRQIYQAWKQIALTPGGTEGTFSRVVLVPDESGTMKLLGFTSGRIVDGDEPMHCVFVPSSPNPITGRLYFVPVEKCQIIQMTAEEAFKIILSTGNYVPPLVSQRPTLPAPPTSQNPTPSPSNPRDHHRKQGVMPRD